MPIQNYPQPPEKPEFVLREGYDKNMPRITYDFNDGCRVMIHPMEQDADDDVRKLARWCNRQNIRKSCTFSSYKRRKEGSC